MTVAEVVAPNHLQMVLVVLSASCVVPSAFCLVPRATREVEMDPQVNPTLILLNFHLIQVHEILHKRVLCCHKRVLHNH